MTAATLLTFSRRRVEGEQSKREFHPHVLGLGGGGGGGGGGRVELWSITEG